jgi:hypothetical protein
MQGLLLAGFSREHSESVQEWMQEMEPSIRVSHVVDDMMTATLGSALYNPDSQVRFHDRAATWQASRTLYYMLDAGSGHIEFCQIPSS